MASTMVEGIMIAYLRVASCFVNGVFLLPVESLSNFSIQSINLSSSALLIEIDPTSVYQKSISYFNSIDYRSYLQTRKSSFVLILKMLYERKIIIFNII